MPSMHTQVFHAAKEGLSRSLHNHLFECSPDTRRELLTHLMDDDDQKYTPLIIAARNGHEKVVATLLKFSPDLEQEGVVKFDGYIIEGASALWCAAGAGHLSIVKALVRAGANVNHPTKTNSTPLRAACFDGRLDIVKYLIIHGASIHITNKYNNTCLMIAAYKGHTDVVRYLLELGADPNVSAHCGATAVHFAAECGHTAIVAALLDGGAAIAANEHGMTPLLAAAERCKAEVVEYLITRPEVNLEARIDALELLGASFASDKDNYDITLAFKYLMVGMQERYKDPEQVVVKPKLAPVPAYDSHIECQTVEELQDVKHVSAVLHMEGLTVRERILGVHNPEVPHPVIFRGAVFADNARFDRCLCLWSHALHLKQQNKACVMKDLLRFAQVFSQMLHIGVQVEFDVVYNVLKATVVEMEQNLQKLRNGAMGKEEPEAVKEEVENIMVTSLYLIMIAASVAKGKCTATTPSLTGRSSTPGACSAAASSPEGDETTQRQSLIHYLAYRLVRVGARTRSGQTLLHLAVNPDTPVDDFHTNHVCRFPCSATTKLLIECGANVNCMDINRNTPLHLIVSYQKPISDFLTLHNIIMSLIENGAHMDTVNQVGATPFESATTGVAEIILRTQKKLNLKCLAARAVRINNISYKGQVPKILEGFIELHGPGHVDALNSKSDEAAKAHV